MNLDELRKRIDAIDKELVCAINERAGIVQSVGKYKMSQGIKPFAPHRERDVYNRIEALNDGPIPSEMLQRIYREIMSASIAMERNIKVGYIGPETSVSHIAALKKFGHSIPLSPCESLQEIFEGIATDELEYGIIPALHTPQAGGVQKSLDAFLENSDVEICADIHCVIHKEETEFYVISDSSAEPSKSDITHLIVGTENEDMFPLVSILHEKNVAFIRAEALTYMSKKWEHTFFFTLKGHCNDWEIETILDLFKENKCHVQVLGSCPATE